MADEIVCCGGATTLLCIGCGYDQESVARIKQRARDGRMVLIRPVLPFFAEQNEENNGNPSALHVRGKMEPCAVTYIKALKDLDGHFRVCERVCEELVSRFMDDPRSKWADKVYKAAKGTAFQWS